MNKSLQIWIEDHELNISEYIPESGILDTDIGKMLILEEKLFDGVLFDKQMGLRIYEREDGQYVYNYSTTAFQIVQNYDIEYFVFEFGEMWFYTKIHSDKYELLLYVGECDRVTNIKGSFLGVHGIYEQMAGIGSYDNYCRKAKFLQYQKLGICEKGTLAGTLPFQRACKKQGIDSVLGYSFDVLVDSTKIEMKAFCINEQGWINLLSIHHNFIDGKLDLDHITNRNQGLVFVIGSTVMSISEKKRDELINQFDHIYYHLTTNELRDQSKELESLKLHKTYIQECWMNDKLDCVLINDAYCLELEDVHLKKMLSDSVAKHSPESINHYMKSVDESFFELEELFKEDDDRLIELFSHAIKNSVKISEMCEYQIDTNSFHLPKYKLTDEEEREFGDEEDPQSALFNCIIEDALYKEGKIDFKQYDEDQIHERLDKEIDVITRGGFIDYFLILWDIIKFCENENILTGVGRGSAGGSLVAYLLGIIKLNPLDYDLLFERFLNEGRIESELPDIDTDFNSERRDEVIDYMKERYGHDYVCRVGTYTTLQAKGAVKELCRLINVDEEFAVINRVTAMIDSENNTSWIGIFKSAANKNQLKGFLKRNGDVFRDCLAVLGAIKSSSQHACATIIVPEYEGRDMWSMIPLRKTDDGDVISEWEGEDLAKAGYLKEDILSTKQMMKLNYIIDLIEKNHNKRYKLEDVPLDDEKVYEYFCQGFTQDVFHFGSDGLTGYLQQLLPQSIHDLIAAIALYRPGAMTMEAHIEYIECKNGQREVEYDYGLEDVLKDTYGVYCYQEQIMRACQVLGGFSLTEADGIRKAMGKKIKDLMDSYKVKFIDGAIEKGCPEDEAHVIWDKLEKFAGYGFNKSHAAAYSIIGYICNWFKVHYPMEFWTVALTKASPDSISGYLSEINNTGNIVVAPPDINVSTDQFVPDFENESVLWSLSKITQCGPSALSIILEERKERGQFFSIEEFCERLSSNGGSRSVKKNTIVNLILSGAFDAIYDIDFRHNITDRRLILKEYFENVREEPLPEEYNTKSRLYWELRQKQLSKLGTLSLRAALLNSSSAMKHYLKSYKTNDQVLSDQCKERDFVMVAGVVTQITHKKDKYERNYADITVNNDGQDVLVRIFADIWMNINGNFDGWQERLSTSQGQVLFISGIISDWRGNRNIQTVSKGSRPSKFDIL